MPVDMINKQVMMLACPTLRREITAFMEEDGLRYPVFYVPDDLHLTPEKLNAYLCDFIPRLQNVDYLLLPMGRCGNGTTGVPSCNTTLVLPKCDDCISLLLSRESLATEARPKYAYFFTDSWLENKRSFIKEYEYTVQKYGPGMGKSLMKSIYRHYQYFIYANTGFGDFESTAVQVDALAKAVDVQVREIDAPCGVLRKMLRLDFDGDFLFVPPGEKVAFEFA